MSVSIVESLALVAAVGTIRLCQPTVTALVEGSNVSDASPTRRPL